MIGWTLFEFATVGIREVQVRVLRAHGKWQLLIQVVNFEPNPKLGWKVRIKGILEVNHKKYCEYDPNQRLMLNSMGLISNSRKWQLLSSLVEIHWSRWFLWWQRCLSSVEKVDPSSESKFTAFTSFDLFGLALLYDHQKAPFLEL